MLISALVVTLVAWKFLGLFGLAIGIFFFLILLLGGLGAVQEDRLESETWKKNRKN